MADRYLITLVAMVGIAIIFSFSAQYLSNQNQQYISDQIQNVSDKELVHIGDIINLSAAKSNLKDQKILDILSDIRADLANRTN